MNDYVEAGRRIAAQINAEALAMGDLSFARAIWKSAGQQLPKAMGAGRPPVAPGEPSVSLWLARVMLFNPDNDIEADSMPDMDINADPDQTCSTLATMGAWVRESAYGFHASREEPQPVGLDQATLDRSILSLRVSLSRNGGVTWWRLPYTVGDRAWRALVRVQRATQ